jgi:hypothetical protein
VHIISQRWQPEQRARSVTIIFAGVVRSSMRPEAMDWVVTPHDASTPPTTRPATPQPVMASTVRRVKKGCFLSAGMAPALSAAEVAAAGGCSVATVSFFWVSDI